MLCSYSEKQNSEFSILCFFFFFLKILIFFHFSDFRPISMLKKPYAKSSPCCVMVRLKRPKLLTSTTIFLDAITMLLYYPQRAIILHIIYIIIISTTRIILAAILLLQYHARHTALSPPCHVPAAATTIEKRQTHYRPYRNIQNNGRDRHPKRER